MILDWFNGREAEEAGTAFADQFARLATGDLSRNVKPTGKTFAVLLEKLASEGFAQRFNFYKKVKFATSFKWRLIENGIQAADAAEITRTLVLHLSHRTNTLADAGPKSAANSSEPAGNLRFLLNQGDKCLADADYSGAIGFYQDIVNRSPRHRYVFNNLGVALYKTGRYEEAQTCFRRALQINPNFADAQANLGVALRSIGQMREAETWLRSAVKLNPRHVLARNNLGLTLAFLGRLGEAERNFRKVLKLQADNAEALYGMGHIAEIEGRFEDAEGLFKRSITSNSKMTSAWGGLVGVRKQSSSDRAWLKDAERLVESELAPLEEADMRFAIGKFYDDIGNFEQAFGSYRRGNELLKSVAGNYEPDLRSLFVDNMVRRYSLGALAGITSGASRSTKPIFVVGMPRSGTSLVEQILASHPLVNGAGELTFWTNVGRELKGTGINGLVGESTKEKLATSYLRELEAKGDGAARIVDKSPMNSDYLGLIHSVFPNALIIYMQRDAIDTCVSCYFQKFAVSLNFAMDLSDLAHYYKEHHRLVAHWRSVIRPGTILDVPYEGLVADQERWTRKILDFLGLEWDDRCLDFHSKNRPVVTASFWQVRQRLYTNSVQRWRHYKKFIKPLLPLKSLTP